jgi:L-asparaginase II
MSQMKNKGQPNPILVEVIRGGVVESQHRGSMVAVNVEGEVIYSAGDMTQLIYPRSALKVLQILPLLELDGASKLNLSPQQISLACASHNGTKVHLEAVEAWLAALELNAEDLECGPAMPVHETTMLDLVRAGGVESRVHNTCSGKHVGMLSLAKLMGESTKGYSSYEHPTQQSWLKRLTALSGVNMAEMVWDRDGCGMPAPQMPMDAFARCWAQFAKPENHEEKTARAMQLVINSIAQHPEMIAGRERCCTAVIEATEGEVIVKTGAEGVFGGVIPKRGIGIALKIDDGATRASEVALGSLLLALGVISKKQHTDLNPFFQTPLFNTQGFQTGEVRAASEAWYDLAQSI